MNGWIPAPLVVCWGVEPQSRALSTRQNHVLRARLSGQTFEGVGAGGQCQADSPFAPRVIRNGKALNPYTVRDRYAHPTMS